MFKNDCKRDLILFFLLMTKLNFLTPLLWWTPAGFHHTEGPSFDPLLWWNDFFFVIINSVRLSTRLFIIASMQYCKNVRY